MDPGQDMLKSESEVTQSCPTLCDPVDCSPPSSSVHGILQARILEWVAISFSRGSSQPRDQTQVSLIAGRCFNLWATREAHNSLWPHGPYSPWNSPGQNTGVGSLSLLQGIFPTQGSNPGLLHCGQIKESEPQGKPGQDILVLSKHRFLHSQYVLERTYVQLWTMFECPGAFTASLGEGYC